MTTNYIEHPITEQVLTGTHHIPVFIPETLLQLCIAASVFESAISKFNYDVKQQELFLTTLNAEQKVALILGIHKENDDLFLVVKQLDGEQIGFLDQASYTARLQGFVFMNPETGTVEEMVIEGFNLVE